MVVDDQHLGPDGDQYLPEDYYHMEAEAEEDREARIKSIQQYYEVAPATEDLYADWRYRHLRKVLFLCRYVNAGHFRVRHRPSRAPTLAILEEDEEVEIASGCPSSNTSQTNTVTRLPRGSRVGSRSYSGFSNGSDTFGRATGSMLKVPNDYGHTGLYRTNSQVNNGSFCFRRVDQRSRIDQSCCCSSSSCR